MSQQINLFNPIFLKQKKHFSAVAMVQGLGLILVGVLVVVGIARFQLAALERHAVATEAQLRATKAQAAKVAADYAPRQKDKALEGQIQSAEAALKLRQEALEVLRNGGAGNTKGYTEYFQAFARQIVPGLWLTGFTIDESGVELRGKALRPELLPTFIGRLRQEPSMRGKSFATLAMQTPEVKPVSSSADTEAKTPRVQAAPEYMEFVLRSTEADLDQAAGADAAGRGGK